MSQPTSITELLALADEGDATAQAELYSLVEPVLRNLARTRKHSTPSGPELRTTVLIDDAFLEIVGRGVTTWAPGDREKFFAYASAKMHDLLIDDLRRRLASKRNYGEAPAPLVESLVPGPRGAGADDVDFQLDLREKLIQLQVMDRDAAVVFRIKSFLSCTFDDVVDLLGAPNRASVVKAYGRALAWLRGVLGDHDLGS